jgi:hypothetical protein
MYSRCGSHAVPHILQQQPRRHRTAVRHGAHVDREIAVWVDQAVGLLRECRRLCRRVRQARVPQQRCSTRGRSQATQDPASPLASSESRADLWAGRSSRRWSRGAAHPRAAAARTRWSHCCAHDSGGQPGMIAAAGLAGGGGGTLAGAAAVGTQCAARGRRRPPTPSAAQIPVPEGYHVHGPLCADTAKRREDEEDGRPHDNVDRSSGRGGVPRCAAARSSQLALVGFVPADSASQR